MRGTGQKCVFFDRDGVVNESPGPGYVERWEDFKLLPDFVRVLRLVRRRGYPAVIVSNQRGVARGVVPAAEVERIHRELRVVLRDRHGLDLLDIFYCPHDLGQCTCRKPAPGMLLAAAERHGLDLSASWMVGDHEKDVEAGSRAGCRTILLGPGDGPTAADYQVEDLKALERLFARLLDKPAAGDGVHNP